MTYTSMIRSPGAIVLGFICALGTAAVLFWPVVADSAPITTGHVLVGLSMIVALGAGHFMWSSAEFSIAGAFRFASFAVLFVAGTAVCVSLSGGRSAEAIIRKEIGVSHENGKRLAQEAKIIAAKADAEAAKASHKVAEADAQVALKASADECATGRKVRCEGRQFSAEVAAENAATKLKLATLADSHYWLQVGELSNLAPPQIANADLKQIAKVIAFFGGYDAQTVEQGVELLWSYALALITEFGTIAFFNYGFGHGRKPVVTVAAEVTKETVPETIPALGFDPVYDALKAAKRPVNNNEIARMLGISKGYASRKVKEAVANGYARKEPNGRYVDISLPRLV